jgi:hypothetical protein
MFDLFVCISPGFPPSCTAFSLSARESGTVTDPLLIRDTETHMCGSYSTDPLHKGIDKGKVPVIKLAPFHEDVSGEWRYSSTHSLTLELDGGEWSALHVPAALLEGKEPPVSIG